jgi:D-alanine transaminase
MSICWLNGKFLPLEQAQISVLDRGFIFGDGIYEVIPVYGGQLFRLTEHLNRLQKNLDLVKIDTKLSHAQWQQLLSQLVQQNGAGDLSVYIQITRGVADRDHGFPAQTDATLFAMTNALKGCPVEILQQGAAAITLDDIRWRYCHIKTTSLLANILLRQQAIEQQAIEAILIRDGLVTEGAASNLFVVYRDTILTPPKSHFLLPGITRDLILELAQSHQLSCKEENITEAILRSADEIWLSSSTKEIVPVTQLDAKIVGEGQPGPVWKIMMQQYQLYKDQVRQGLLN